MDPVSDLLAFLDASPTAFHAAAGLAGRLSAAGFAELAEGERWRLRPGARAFVRRHDGALMAFRLGRLPPGEAGFRVAVAHLDSPGLRLKLDSERSESGTCRIGIEVYGSPIVHTWLDRELSVAGRVVVAEGKGAPAVRLVDLRRPVAIIPNLAIHLNRDVNKGFEFNAQHHLQAILTAGSCGVRNSESATAGGGVVRGWLAAALGVAAEAIRSVELFLYDPRPACRLGPDGDMIVSGRLDNLAMSHAILLALTGGTQGAPERPRPQTSAAANTAVALFYDHEEIGSRSERGAESSLAETVLERLVLATGGTREDLHRALAKTLLVSADMAHAVHPNFADKHDPAYAPRLNAGPVIKSHAALRYATGAEGEAWFEACCRAVGVPCQRFIMRSDLACGSTIGPTTASLLGVRAVDVGNPMWAMHSSRETAGAADHAMMARALAAAFQQHV